MSPFFLFNFTLFLFARL